MSCSSTILPVSRNTDSQIYYSEEDCVDAIAGLQHSDYDSYGQNLFEFLAPGAGAWYGYPYIVTPRRYTVRTCTIAIAMLVNFPPGMLPGEPPRLPYGFSDVSSFAQMWSAARQIDHFCEGVHGSLGWAMEGDINHAIGVFIWVTDSHIDNFLLDYYGTGPLSIVTNGSVAGSRASISLHSY